MNDPVQPPPQWPTEATAPQPPSLLPTIVGSYATGPHRKLSGAAVASLVLGVFGCIPFVTGVLAIIFAAVGMRRTRDPRLSGRGIAIAGLVLGIVNLAAWSLFSGAMLAAYVRSGAARAVAEQFVIDVAGGNNTAAQSKATGNIPPPALDKLAAEMKAWGPLQEVSFTRSQYGVYGGMEISNLHGTARFASTTKGFAFRLIKQGGAYKVDGAHFFDTTPASQTAPATSPATAPTVERAIGE